MPEIKENKYYSAIEYEQIETDLFSCNTEKYC